MSVQRLKNIPGFSIDRVAAEAGDDPEVLRLENLDTDLAPPAAALAATQAAVGRDEDNSYLPFTLLLATANGVLISMRCVLQLAAGPAFFSL